MPRRLGDLLDSEHTEDLTTTHWGTLAVWSSGFLQANEGTEALSVRISTKAVRSCSSPRPRCLRVRHAVEGLQLPRRHSFPSPLPSSPPASVAGAPPEFAARA